MLDKGIGPDGDWKMKTASEGLGTDCCPNCGTNVEAAHTLGDQNNPMGFLYSHGQEDGGCGAQWNRTTSIGMKKADKYDPKWPTTSVAVGRVYSTPSRRYSANYASIFGHD